MMIVEWEDPPRQGQGIKRNDVLHEFVSILETQPGRWAKYPEVVKLRNVVSNYGKRYPHTEWTSRKIGNEIFVWGRVNPLLGTNQTTRDGG